MSVEIPVGYGVCPVCSGNLRKPAKDIPHKERHYGYDEATDTLPCYNCGAQKMYGRATGLTKLRADGEPCKHDYEHRLIGRCYHNYRCKHCNDSYDIDSGD